MTTTAARKRPTKVDPDDFRPDPHAGFARHRPLSGVLQIGAGFPTVVRYADIMALISDTHTRQLETEALVYRGIAEGSLFDFYANSLLLSNAPAHARRRAPLSRAFAFRLIQDLRPHIRALVGGMLDEIGTRGETDFLAAFASPLPARLIADILGIPREEAPDFAAKVYTMTRGLGGFRDEDFPAIEAAAADLMRYVENLLAERRREPREDFLSSYLARVDEDGTLSPIETLMQIVSVIVGGSDTTRFGLTSTVSQLLQKRAQWEALTADPALAPGAVLEGLRYEPPVGAIGRVVTVLVEIDGVRLEPGTVVNLSILSGQRDETVFAEPHVFDVGRQDHPRWSLSFGHGVHRCVGEALARAEMEEALIVLSQRLPGLTLAGDPPVAKGHTGIRGITAMPVAWG